MIKKKTKDGKTTFIRITNKDIYDSIQELKEQLISLKEKNDIDHLMIIKRQDVTNGKVKLNKWIATTALTIVLTIMFYLLKIH